jgi:transcription-repair coupling factor (superfamily II helicase)
LLLEEGRTVTPTAAKRLKAIEEFSELGAGFKIAMRDLEIRGAGNILGTEQSGHISSVGYELYCQLLENAVRRLKKEPLREHPHVAVDLPVSAYLPGSYVPPGRPKIDVYRKLSAVGSIGELTEVESEIRDRFGPIPDEVTRLIEMKRLQVYARAWGIDDIHLEDGYAVFGYRNPSLIRQLASKLKGRLRIVDTLHAYLVLPRGEWTGAALLDELKSVLQTD